MDQISITILNLFNKAYSGNWRHTWNSRLRSRETPLGQLLRTRVTRLETLPELGVWLFHWPSFASLFPQRWCRASPAATHPRHVSSTHQSATLCLFEIVHLTLPGRSRSLDSKPRDRRTHCRRSDTTASVCRLHLQPRRVKVVFWTRYCWAMHGPTVHRLASLPLYAKCGKNFPHEAASFP